MIEIKSRWNSTQVIFTDQEACTLKEAVVKAASQGADLAGADLEGADLEGADLAGANLRGAHLAELDKARLSIVPESGPFHAWKKCSGDVLVRLEIPHDAYRSNATGRKCRASHALVLEVIGADVGVSMWDKTTKYKVGEIVRADHWDENPWNECSGGIHYFITRAEAEDFVL